MAYFHCQTRIQIRTRISNPMSTLYYAEHVSTDSDSDLDPFPTVFVLYRNPNPSPNPSPALEISHNSDISSKCCASVQYSAIVSHT